VVGAGKAARSMAEAVAQVVGSALRGGGIVVPRGLDVSPIGAITVEAGGHPVPDAAGEAATRRLLDAVAAADPTTLVLVVLSGGASALLVAPASGVELRDKQDVTRRLLLAGADIAALNTVRKHCSRVKAGGPLLSKARTVVVGRNRDAVAAAATAAKARGYDTSVVADPLHGDAASAGRAVAGALAAARRDRPVAVVGGGETTVRVVGDG